MSSSSFPSGGKDHGWTILDAQTTIDACVDGSWEGVLLLGSTFICRVHGPTLIDTARLLDAELTRIL